MFSRKKKSKNKHILRLGITINVSELAKWFSSENDYVPVVPYAKWGAKNNFEYLVFILPIDDDIGWYFHKNATEYSHSINSIIDLGNHFHSNVDINKICDGLQPELEIDLWHGQLSVAFCRKLLFMAPLHEAVCLMSSGKTSSGSFVSPQKGEIEVPIAYGDDLNATQFMPVYEHLDGSGASYSNYLVHLWLNVPKGPVVVGDF